MKTSKRFSRAEGGNVLIEFALLAPVFFMLIMGLVEFVLFQYKTYALNHVVYEAARNLQTGEVQNSERHGGRLPRRGLRPGRRDDRLRRRSFSTSAPSTLSTTSPIRRPSSTTKASRPISCSSPAAPNQYSVVRAAIHHQFVTPFMDKLFRMGPDMPAIVNAYCIVKNEPWS